MHTSLVYLHVLGWFAIVLAAVFGVLMFVYYPRTWRGAKAFLIIMACTTVVGLSLLRIKFVWQPLSLLALVITGRLFIVRLLQSMDLYDKLFEILMYFSYFAALLGGVVPQRDMHFLVQISKGSLACALIASMLMTSVGHHFLRRPVRSSSRRTPTEKQD